MTRFMRCPSLSIVKILFTLPGGNSCCLLHVHGNCWKMKR
ncbi:hypothetical protein GGE66_002759 [Rhizobium leguminosarum]|uniref:Uncharacterized protein n=1 Tax=Rhizobium leguminosarum TaxID=384 RepID=A0A7X0DSW3_RHILE|nr:hypothetical protein [Rhizobium leguminosarum]